ncbi:MAG: hypothetical protein ACR2GR_04600 [Rhodothermales bacterium]
MCLLRSTWGMRLLAAVMAVSVVPLVAGPLAGGSRQAAAAPYADWLREQLRTEADAPIEAALEAAVASQPQSLRAFLETFVGVLEAQRPGLLAERGWVPSGLSAQAAADYLQRHLSQFAADARTPALVAVSGTSASPTPDRLALAQALLVARTDVRPVWQNALRACAEATLVFPLRLRWAAFPLGP